VCAGAPQVCQPPSQCLPFVNTKACQP
jgi:hypothetical protein